VKIYQNQDYLVKSNFSGYSKRNGFNKNLKSTLTPPGDMFEGTGYDWFRP
jgi:hypothetical protein